MSCAKAGTATNTPSASNLTLKGICGPLTTRTSGGLVGASEEIDGGCLRQPSLLQNAQRLQTRRAGTSVTPSDTPLPKRRTMDVAAPEFSCSAAFSTAQRESQLQ